MAGLYDYWKDPDTNEILSSFAIITISANQLLQSIGIKRMPVILTPGYEKDWLKPDRPLSDVLHMLRQIPPQKMNAYPVSERIDIPGLNDPLMIKPIGEKIQSEGMPDPKVNRLYHYYQKKKADPGKPLGERGKKD